MPATDFGKALAACRRPTDHIVLATRMLSRDDFTLISVSDPYELAQHLVNIEAGARWPFAPDDLNPFMLAAQQSLPERSVSADTALRLATAAYFYEL